MIRSVRYLCLFPCLQTLPATVQAQGPTIANLSAPGLAAHATLPQHNRVGPTLAEALAAGRNVADAKGLPWKGMDLVVSDDPGNLAGFSIDAMLKLYQTLACQADAVAVGRVNGSVSHVGSSGTTVYSDVSFVADAVLKDNRANPVMAKGPVVVTRLGGTVALPAGRVQFDFKEFPRWEPGVVYLQFLKHIPASGGYHPVDSFSTLVLENNRWVISRKAFSRIALPDFDAGVLEAQIQRWVAVCK